MPRDRSRSDDDDEGADDEGADDERADERRRPTAPRRPPHAGDALAVVKWLLLGLGGALAFAALTASAVQAGAIAGLACFLGIAARVVQAEQHRYPK